MSFYDNIDRIFHDWNYGHPKVLWGFIRAMKPLSIVDCGTYRGYSACWMAKACQENNIGRVHCIDNFSLREHVDRYGDPLAHLEANLTVCGVREWVEIHQGDTSDTNMWPQRVDVAYIDGWHSFEQCQSDFEMAERRGAILIALDDTENCVGPRMFVDHARKMVGYKSWDILDLHTDNGLTIFLARQPKRPITFSQELPLPCVGVDLRPLSLEQQAEHFKLANELTGLDYSKSMQETMHDMKL